MGDRIELPNDEKAAIEPWLIMNNQLILSDPENGNYGALREVADFAARHYYISRRHSPSEINHSNPEIMQRVLHWDKVDPPGGGMRWWQQFPSAYITDDEIEYFTKNPPRTRAARRAAYFKNNDLEIQFMDYTTIKYKNGKIIKMLDAYQYED